jgi:hypothetical protein
LGKLRTDGYLKALENNDSINENLIFKNWFRRPIMHNAQ